MKREAILEQPREQKQAEVSGVSITRESLVKYIVLKRKEKEKKKETKPTAENAVLKGFNGRKYVNRGSFPESMRDATGC